MAKYEAAITCLSFGDKELILHRLLVLTYMTSVIYIDGRRSRGRKRVKYVESLMEVVEENWTSAHFIQAAWDRPTWKGMIVNVKDTAPRYRVKGNLAYDYKSCSIP